MDTSGFYKLNESGLLFAPNFVHMPGLSIHKDNEEDKTGTYNGWQWFDNEALAYTHHGLVAGNNPLSISPLQAKIALARIDKLDAVEQAVSAAGIEAKLAWNNATEFKRDSPLLAQLSIAAGLSDLDALFATARSISV